MSWKIYFVELAILTVYGIYIYETIILTKRSLFTNDESIIIHNNNTISTFIIKTDTHNKDLYKKSPTYTERNFYDELTKHIINVTNYKKLNDKQCLINETLNSMNEYFSYIYII